MTPCSNQRLRVAHAVTNCYQKSQSQFKDVFSKHGSNYTTIIDASFKLCGEFQAKKYSMTFLWNPWNALANGCTIDSSQLYMPVGWVIDQ